VLAAVVLLAVGVGAAPVGGQNPDSRDDIIKSQQELIANQQTLIDAQESLLNDYRCLFDIDTQLVPNGCPEPVPTPTAPPTAAPASTPAPLPGATIPAGTTEGQWEQLRQCESNGNYRAYNPAGPYLGAFQFLQSTWNSVANRNHPRLAGVDPRDASPADQYLMAYALYQERGWAPWPACTAAFRSS